MAEGRLFIVSGINAVVVRLGHIYSDRLAFAAVQDSWNLRLDFSNPFVIILHVSSKVFYSFTLEEVVWVSLGDYYNLIPIIRRRTFKM